MKLFNLIPFSIVLLSGSVTHCGNQSKETNLKDNANASTEYYVGNGHILLPGNTEPEEYEYVVINQRTLDPDNLAIKMNSISSDDAKLPCYLDESSATLSVIKDSITEESARFVATKIKGAGEELAELSTRPTSKKHHGELTGKPWEWTKVESLILGKSEGEIHRLGFSDVNEGDKLAMTMSYGICFNDSCTKDDEYNLEYTLKYNLEKVSKADYDAKEKYLREYSEKNPEKCAE